MTLTELKHLYAHQDLIEALVEPSINSGYIVEFRHRHGGLVPLTDIGGSEQCYGDVDSATQQAFEVGFQQVRIADEY
ncbi:thymidylate kinase [Photobacterium phosphoreum]|uniref:thymidylate kinase n=1 Tax=Photobacterium phosphoreum TaxID=659 RepID=UPI001E36D6F0|nr:thymidylate kinase [Photobacterium phosphoreum]MCD9508629.1 thymidylate kinase [Photobacterium phosphoreum]